MMPTDVILGVAIVLAIGLGGWIERIRHRGAGTTPEEAWDNGCQHGLRLAHKIVAEYPKPWINFGEERGWDLARNQLTSELSTLLGETLPNETNGTAIQAANGGVS
jgi:hypothetical protein